MEDVDFKIRRVDFFLKITKTQTFRCLDSVSCRYEIFETHSYTRDLLQMSGAYWTSVSWSLLFLGVTILYQTDFDSLRVGGGGVCKVAKFINALLSRGWAAARLTRVSGSSRIWNVLSTDGALATTPPRHCTGNSGFGLGTSMFGYANSTKESARNIYIRYWHVSVVSTHSGFKKP